MRRLAVLLALAGCAQLPQETAIPASFPPFCQTNAALPAPPPIPRTGKQLTQWAQEAGDAANNAIKERDDCAKNYVALRAWVYR